jgi:ankyrin repeat protein
VNAKDNFGNTPLHLACFHNKTECINKLLELKNINLNCTDLFRRTPAFYCARNGNKEILEKLIQKVIS